MKKLIYIPVIIILIATGCSETEYLSYAGADRIQMSDTVTTNFTFVYELSSVTVDTVYIRVNTIGNVANHDREVKLIQVPEYSITYERDPVTGNITDTIETELPNKAVPGQHYVDFSDASLKKMYVIKANEVTALIPVVLLRDASLKDASFRLRVQLDESAEFGLGELKARAKTIIFSDRLERFYSWRVDNYQAAAYGTLGNYSTVKHQFMINVIGEVIDEAWWQEVSAVQAQAHYRNLLKEALNKYNNDPVNIANGTAPLRETNNPGSALVTFP
ncbi:DUF4843 domain-containing protein [Dysgonomonas reticulitermitis]